MSRFRHNKQLGALWHYQRIIQDQAPTERLAGVGASGRAAGRQLSCTIRCSCHFLLKSSSTCPLLCRCSTAAQMHPVHAKCWLRIKIAGLVLSAALSSANEGYNRPFEEKLYSQACTMCRPESFCPELNYPCPRRDRMMPRVIYFRARLALPFC